MLIIDTSIDTTGLTQRKIQPRFENFCALDTVCGLLYPDSSSNLEIFKDMLLCRS